MKKAMGYVILMILALILAGCSASPDTAAPLPSPTPQIVPPPVVQAQGAFADAARALLDPYQHYLDQIAEQCKNNLSYTIPGDIISKMARDAQEMNVIAANGRYQFTWRQSGRHSYMLTGLSVQEELSASATQAPAILSEDYNPMEDQAMGDFVAAGGGNFDRSYAYDVAEDLSSGSAEITNTLNDEITGHEFFSFCRLGDSLYFSYGALELTANLDELTSDGSYLVTIGKFEKNSVETADYLVYSRSDIPNASVMDFEKLLSSVTSLARLSANGNRVSVSD